MPRSNLGRRFWMLMLLVSAVGIAGLSGCLVREEEVHDRGHEHDHDQDRVVVIHRDVDHDRR